MNSVDSYIRQVVVQPLFSVCYTKLFSPNTISGDLECNFNYQDKGAMLIHLHSVVFNIKNTVLAGSFNLTDNYGSILMRLNRQVSMNGLYYFDYVINAPQIKLTLVGSNTIVDFLDITAQYQYVYANQKDILATKK